MEGPAAAAIKGLPLTADNYGAAKEILEKRFEQKQIVINAHMEGLVKLSPVSCNDDLKRLRQLHDQVESHVRALQAIGIDKDAYGTLLLPLLLEKIPMDLRLIISRKIDTSEWDLDTLLQSFDNEIEAREQCEVMTPKTPKKPNYTQQPNGGKINPSTAAALLNQGTKSVSCTYCRGEHPSWLAFIGIIWQEIAPPILIATYVLKDTISLYVPVLNLKVPEQTLVHGGGGGSFA